MLALGGALDEAPELHDLHLALDTDLQQHGLNGLTDLDAGLIVVHPQLAGEAVRISRLGQQLPGQFDVVGIGLVSGVAEHARRDEVAGRLAPAVHDGVDDRVHVDGVPDRLAHQLVVKGLLLHVERKVPAVQARLLVQCQVGVVADLLLVVGLDVVCDVHLARLESDGALRGLRDDLHHEVLRLGGARVVLVEGLQLQGVPLLPAHELVGPRPDGVQTETRLVGLHVGLRNDGRGGVRQVPQRRRVGLGRLDDDGVIVHDADLLDEVHDVGNCGGGDRPIQGELHVRGREGRTVVKLDPAADVDLELRVAEVLPRLRDLPHDLPLVVRREQRVEDLVRRHDGRGLLADVGIQRRDISSLSPGQRVLVLRRR